MDYISGASIIIRKKLWDKIGGFDESYMPAYYEDADIAFKIRELGYKVVYQPQSIVVHMEGVSHGKSVKKGIKQYQIINLNKFVLKWKNILENDHNPFKVDIFLARERSKKRKKILIIDSLVPTWDQDAGSRTSFHYIKLFLEMGFQVKFIPDNFARIDPYVAILEQMGVEVLYGKENMFFLHSWMRNNLKYFHYVYLNRPDVSIKYIKYIKKYSNAKILYNSVDFHFLREERKYLLSGDKSCLKRSKQYKKIEFYLFRKADHVMTISEYERSILHDTMPDKKIHVFPTFIYTSDFPQGKLNKKKGYKSRKDITFIGGFNHPPNVDAVLWFFEKIFPKLKNELPDLVVNVLGSNPPKEILKLKSNHINVTGYVSDEDLDKYYAKTLVVIVPLRYGAGVKGKVIEAIAHAIPVVTTSIGAEGILNSHDVLCVKDEPREFVDEIKSIINDEKLWIKYRTVQIDYCQKYLTIQAAKKLFTEILC